jgi:hypothetical protein
MPSKQTTIRVDAPRFCASLALDDDGVCVRAAPILASRRALNALGRGWAEIKTDLVRRGWKFTVITDVTKQGERQ